MAKVYIEGYIGESDGWAEMFGGESMCFGAKDMRKFLDDNKDATDIEVEIRSGGGSVDVGIDIYDQLINSGKNITTIAYECASIATVIFLAGSARKVSKNSAPLIHNPWIDGWALSGMDANSLAELSDQLRGYEDRILNIYVERTGADRTELSDIMSKDTPMTSDEFQRLGFATEIINGAKATTHKAIAFCSAHKLENQMNKKEVKSWFEKIEGMIKNLTKPQVKNLQIALKDGVNVYVKTDAESPAVGDEVYTDEAYTTAAPDGEHVTSDNKVIILEAGKITEIKEEMQDASKDEEIAALKAKIEELEMAKAYEEEEKTKALASLKTMTEAKAASEANIVAIKKEIDEFKALIDAEPERKPRELTKAEIELEKRRKLRNYGKAN
jgi:ATP-dependent Clp protease, protease subunit